MPVVPPGESVQLGFGVKVPVPVEVNATVPVGVVGDAFVSVTVAVHEEGLFTFTELGTQLTEVVVRSPILSAIVRVGPFFVLVPDVPLVITCQVVATAVVALKTTVTLMV